MTLEWGAGEEAMPRVCWLQRGRGCGRDVFYSVEHERFSVAIFLKAANATNMITVKCSNIFIIDYYLVYRK